MSDTGLGMNVIEDGETQMKPKGQKPLVRMLNTDLNRPDKCDYETINCLHCDHETLVCPHCGQKPIIMLLPIEDMTAKGIKFRAEVPIDYCLVDLVRCLKVAGIETKSSCCGHGAEYGSIELMDGRELIVKRAKVAEKKPRNSQSS